MADHDDAQDYTANGPSAFGFRTGGANINVGAELTGKNTGVHGTGQKIGVLGEGSDVGVLGKGTSKLGGPLTTGVSGVGVRGESPFDDGVVGISGGNQKSGVFGFNELKGGGPAAFGVFGRCDSVDGAGVGGRNEGAGSDGFGGPGVRGSSVNGDGIVGSSDATSKSGVFGFNLHTPGPAFGVAGTVASTDGAGILGFTDAGTGVKGTSKTGRGGAFESGKAAQLQLIPHPATFKLPKAANNGDLLALDVMHPTVTGGATLDTELWFCTRGNSGAADAIWRRVQFYP